MGEKITIKDCAKNYGISEITLRRWIKRRRLSAELINGQYFIDTEEIEKVISREKEESGIEEINSMLDTLKRENEALSVRIKDLEREVEFQKGLITRLEEDKKFLQGQIQQLTNTINLLTTKQLPPPNFLSRIRESLQKGEFIKRLSRRSPTDPTRSLKLLKDFWLLASYLYRFLYFGFLVSSTKILSKTF